MWSDPWVAWRTLSESSRTCSCFAFRDILNPWVWKGTFNDTAYHITFFFLSLTSACLKSMWLYFLQILAPALLIIQVHWISEWREKKTQWLALSFFITCVRLSPEDEVQCCGVLRRSMPQETGASLAVCLDSILVNFLCLRPFPSPGTFTYVLSLVA